VSDESARSGSYSSDFASLVISALALLFVALYPVLWWFARGLMEWRVVGTAIPFSVPFAIFVLVVPLILAWWFVRKSDASEREDTND
jgi:uncharacterized membrane protein (DUF485 family)